MKHDKLQLGFTLTETIIYIFLSSIFFLLIFQFAVYNHGRYKSERENCTKKITIWNALDILSQDVRKALLSGYKKQQKDEIIFSTNSYDVGWKFTEYKLYRATGKYNDINNSWLEKNESLAAKYIERIEFNVSSDQKFLSIILEFKINDIPIKIEYYASTRMEVFILPVTK